MSIDKRRRNYLMLQLRKQKDAGVTSLDATQSPFCFALQEANTVLQEDISGLTGKELWFAEQDKELAQWAVDIGGISSVSQTSLDSSTTDNPNIDLAEEDCISFELPAEQLSEREIQDRSERVAPNIPVTRRHIQLALEKSSRRDNGDGPRLQCNSLPGIAEGYNWGCHWDALKQLLVDEGVFSTAPGINWYLEPTQKTTEWLAQSKATDLERRTHHVMMDTMKYSCWLGNFDPNGATETRVIGYYHQLLDDSSLRKSLENAFGTKQVMDDIAWLKSFAQGVRPGKPREQGSGAYVSMSSCEDSAEAPLPPDAPVPS